MHWWRDRLVNWFGVVGVLQGSFTTTLRLTTVLSTWPGSATCSPPSPCSWSRWLGAGRPRRYWPWPRRQKAAARQMAASPWRTALCKKDTQGEPRSGPAKPWTMDCNLKLEPKWLLMSARELHRLGGGGDMTTVAWFLRVVWTLLDYCVELLKCQNFTVKLQNIIPLSLYYQRCMHPNREQPPTDHSQHVSSQATTTYWNMIRFSNTTALQ